MANIRTKKIGRLILAAGAASLLISNASATQVSQQASEALQAMTNAEVEAQQQSLMKLDQTQQIMNQALTKILAKNQADNSISVDSLQKQTSESDLNDKQLNDEMYMQLQSYVNTHSEIVEGILSFDCVVGQKGCIYKDRNSLATGKMVPLAKNKLIKQLTVNPNKKPIVLAKVSKQNNLAQTIKKAKTVTIKPQSKSIIKNKAVLTKPVPSKKINIQQNAQINVKSKVATKDNSLIRKQKDLMKGINNPIDEIEHNLSKVIKNKNSESQAASEAMTKDLLKPSTQTFNKIYENMEHFKIDKKHIDVHEEKDRLNTNHEIQEHSQSASTGSIRKERHTMGNQGAENVQVQDVAVPDTLVQENTEIMQQLDLDKMFKDNSTDSEKDSRPIDKTALMTGEGKHHHHAKKPKADIKLQKAQDLVNASTKQVNSDKKLDELIKKHVSCPKCKECPKQVQQAAQTVSPLEELATHSNEMMFMSADEKPEEVRFQIMPQDLRDFVTKDVQVLNSERIIGYNTYNNILEQQGNNKRTAIDSNSDFYNVTVNFITKRKPQIVNGKQINQGPKELPLNVYENSIQEVEKQQMIQSQEKADQLAEEESEPKVIMPTELASGQDVANVQTMEQTETQAQIVTETEGQTGVVEQTLENLPIELNNAQIASQIQNLTPEEAIQLAQEARGPASGKPANAVNLMLSEDISILSANTSNSTQQLVQAVSEGGVDVKDLQGLASLDKEGKSIEESFTDYIVPESEKNMVESIFDQKLEAAQPTAKPVKAEVKVPAPVPAPAVGVVQNETVNSTSLSSGLPSTAEHFSFLSRVSQKAKQELEDEQKGIRRPLSDSKMTQKLFSQAKMERDEAQVKKEINEAQAVPKIEVNATNLTQQKSQEKTIEEQATQDEDFAVEDGEDQEEMEEPAIDEITVNEDELDQPQQATIMTAQKKSPKVKIQSKLGKTIQKAERLKKKLQKLQADNAKSNKKHMKVQKSKKQSRTLSEVFDQIQHLDNFAKKQKTKNSQSETEINHKIKKDIHFGRKFLKKKIELNTDRPLSTLKNVSAKHKLKKISKKKMKHPFGKTSNRAGKAVDKVAESKKKLKFQEKQKKHHDTIKESISNIFKGKNKLTASDKKKFNDPVFKSRLFEPDDAIHIKDIIAKKKSLNAHNLFKGKTNEQKMIKKMLKKKQKADEEDDDEEEEAAEQKKKSKKAALIKKNKKAKEAMKKIRASKKGRKAQSMYEVGANSFSQQQIIDMEEATLQKKIDIDLKVLSKIENDKHPNEPQFHFKVIKEYGDNEQDQEVPEEPEQVDNTTQSLVQNTTVAQGPVVKQAADEFVQSTAQNILDIKEMSQMKNVSQQLTQTQAHQQALKDMTELQKQFTETSKEKEEIKQEEENAQNMKKMQEEKAEAEEKKRQELMNKAQQMAQADLVAKHALRKATEQAAIDKEQNMLNFEKKLQEEQKILAEKQKTLENHKKEALKARQLVDKVQKEESEVKGRLEKEEKIRADLEKKELEKAKIAMKKTEEIQKQHKQKMQQLITQQVELQNKKKKILSDQESERKRLEDELTKVNKVKNELLKVSEPETNDNQDSSQSKSIADNLDILNQQQIVIQQAIDKVKLAEEQGAIKGLAEAEKMIKRQENQSLEQSEADMKHLQNKFTSTSEKVGNIVSNFQKVHSDLQTLKKRYSTNSSQSGEDDHPQSEEEVQLSNKLSMLEQSNLALKMHSKQRQMKQIVNSLDEIKTEIPDNTALQTKIQQAKQLGLQDLLMIDNQLNLPAH